MFLCCFCCFFDGDWGDVAIISSVSDGGDKGGGEGDWDDGGDGKLTTFLCLFNRFFVNNECDVKAPSELYPLLSSLRFSFVLMRSLDRIVLRSGLATLDVEEVKGNGDVEEELEEEDKVEEEEIDEFEEEDEDEDEVEDEDGYF